MNTPTEKDSRLALDVWRLMDSGAATAAAEVIANCRAQCVAEATAELKAAGDKLASMIMDYRNALYDGPENLTSRTNDELERKADGLIAEWEERK